MNMRMTHTEASDLGNSFSGLRRMLVERNKLQKYRINSLIKRIHVDPEAIASPSKSPVVTGKVPKEHGAYRAKQKNGRPERFLNHDKDIVGRNHPDDTADVSHHRGENNVISDPGNDRSQPFLHRVRSTYRDVSCNHSQGPGDLNTPANLANKRSCPCNDYRVDVFRDDGSPTVVQACACEYDSVISS